MSVNCIKSIILYRPLTYIEVWSIIHKYHHRWISIAMLKKDLRIFKVDLQKLISFDFHLYKEVLMDQY